MLELTHVYWLCGLYLAYVALQTLRDRAHGKRIGTAAFWGLLSAAFLAGDGVLPGHLAWLTGTG